METATRDETPAQVATAPTAAHRVRELAAALAGPALIVVSVIVALRGFVFGDLLSNQHPDILSFWLPRTCYLGRSLAAGQIPYWNPFEMLGAPFAADAQSGWLSVTHMVLTPVFGCGGGLRALIVVQPLIAGLGLFWFLRKEGCHRTAATIGGLSLAMAIAASNVAISLVFAGSLAWTTLVLVGASGYLSATGSRRFPWLALGAFAWGQVAASHLSHGLVMGTGIAVAYLIARTVGDVRAGRRDLRSALLLGLAFLAFLPLANIAILLPRFALISRSSLRGGYAALGGTLARAAGIADRPLPTNGVWSAWPFSLASTPGAYVGAALLLLVPAAFRARGHRSLVAAFASVGALAYLLTLNLFVGAGWFRQAVLRLPFGDVYLHNPGRLRYLALLIVPVLGAVGLQGFLERLPSPREALWWLGGGVTLALVAPLTLGADPFRFVVLALGILVAAPVLLALLRGAAWGAWALPVVLTVELLAGALWSSAYRGGTVFVGLEGADHPQLASQPLRWPTVPVDRYRTPGPIARLLRSQGSSDGRYAAWIPPAAYFNKGYLFTQDERDWPALLLGRALLFELNDTIGYSPIQLPRYWSYIRATDRLPVFYNASVLQLPSASDARLLGIRYLIVPKGVEPPLPGGVVTSERGYDLYEVDGWQPRTSVVPHWTQVDGVTALRRVLDRAFNPAIEAVVEGAPEIPPAPASAAPGTATYEQVSSNEARIAVDAPAPSIVVVRNAWDRDWSATVDGDPAPVLRADYLLQGIPVAAGRHEIVLTYRDPTIPLGLALSGVAWVLFGVAWAVTLVRERRRGRAATDGRPA